MPDCDADKISAWFLSNDGDGEFTVCDRGMPYTVIGPTRKSSHVVIATKVATMVSAFQQSSIFLDVGLVARAGLPQEVDVAWVRDLIRGRRAVFLGDADPVDLLVFAWWRAQLPDISIAYVGINDSYLDISKVSLSESHTIPMSDSEVRAMQLCSEALPDLAQVVGQRCANLLSQGRKLEIEGVVSASGNTAALLSIAAATERWSMVS